MATVSGPGISLPLSEHNRENRRSRAIQALPNENNSGLIPSPLEAEASVGERHRHPSPRGWGKMF